MKARSPKSAARAETLTDDRGFVTAGSQYRTASDGLLARVSGEWAKEKLHYLANYMAIFNGGMKNKWPSRVFLDLMAGPGRCIIDGTDEEFDGSPLRALRCEPAFSKAVFVEAAPDLIAALTTRVAPFGERAQVMTGDCNAAETISGLRKPFDRSTLGLAFADMLGLEVVFETFATLSDGIRLDLAITFQVNDLTRNVPQVMQGRLDGTRLDRFFGSVGWRDVVARFERGDRKAPDLASALTDYYATRLGTLGYAHVAQLHVLMRNNRNAPLYRLILAGKHELAAVFFRKISKIEYDGQRNMF
jgi:three-Cys-motif partner protein